MFDANGVGLDLGWPHLVAALVAVALNAYVLFGGADFGGGVWDLLASGPRRDRQRALVAQAIGPIWEANHVWLILAIVLLFTCFPPVYARLGTVLHIPLTLMLIGIVLRGSAFAFRSFDTEHDAAQRRWGRIFAVASLLTPVLLGVSIGAIAAGRAGPPSRAGFFEGYLAPWLTPFAGAVGLLTLTLFAFLAAVFLTLETDEPDLREDFRRRALGAGVAVFLTSALALALARRSAPDVVGGLLESRWALPWHLATGAVAVGTFAALWHRRWRLARVAAAAQVSLIFWGWVIAQHPYLVPPDLTVENTAAPAVTLRLVVGALALGAVVLLPSLLYLFRIFKSGPASESPAAQPQSGRASIR
jgi:cytochrome d ubiquinol oxidase subunit II